MDVPYVAAASEAQQAFDAEKVANVKPVIATKVQELHPVDLERALEYEDYHYEVERIPRRRGFVIDAVGHLKKYYFAAWLIATNLGFIIMNSFILFKCQDEKTQTLVLVDLLFLSLITLSLIFLFEIKRNNNDVVISWFRILFLGSTLFYISTLTSLPRNNYLEFFIWHFVYSFSTTLCISAIFFMTV
jgi:hypothetical protein